MTVSVIIVTLNRSECVRRCLQHLMTQTFVPQQIIVVDASQDELTYTIVQEFSTVLYLRNDNGYGRMTASRNIGLKSTTGDIIAFLDDDAFAFSGWLEALTNTYTNDGIGAVGGRALNNQPDEAMIGVNKIGLLQTNGELTGYFAADPGKTIEVDHIMGCNMSFRRKVLFQLGGFREDYPGVSGVREDSDMCLRVKKIGYSILFNPNACVEHIGAPQVKGKRFDLRYDFYAQHNHLILLIRNFGLSSSIVWRYLGFNSLLTISNFIKRLSMTFLRPIVIFFGMAVGIVSGIRLLLKTHTDPVRHDQEGQTISVLLDGP